MEFCVNQRLNNIATTVCDRYSHELATISDEQNTSEETAPETPTDFPLSELIGAVEEVMLAPFVEEIRIHRLGPRLSLCDHAETVSRIAVYEYNEEPRVDMISYPLGRWGLKNFPFVPSFAYLAPSSLLFEELGWTTCTEMRSRIERKVYGFKKMIEKYGDKVVAKDAELLIVVQGDHYALWNPLAVPFCNSNSRLTPRQIAIGRENFFLKHPSLSLPEGSVLPIAENVTIVGYPEVGRQDIFDIASGIKEAHLNGSLRLAAD